MDDLSYNPDIITPETQDKFFADLPLNPRLISLYKSFKFLHPTPIQYKSIPIGLQNHHVIAQSKAGTGKTLAYSSIILNKLMESEEALDNSTSQHLTIKYLILSPTRELAIQIHKFLSKFFHSGSSYFLTTHRAGLCIGGLPISDIINSLKQRSFDLLVGTIGRISELLRVKSLDFKNLEFVVLDEADKLMGSENAQQVSQILGGLNTKTRILAFSATFSPKNLEKIQTFAKDSVPVEIRILPNLKRKPETELPLEDQNTDLNLSSILQISLEVLPEGNLYMQKTETLIKLLRGVKFSQCLVFYNEKRRGEELSSDLKEEGFEVTFIHGDQTQSDRIKVMNRLSLSKVNILVSTDLLSRGIDILNIDLVVNYDMPKKIETYFHRIGRTGRYGRRGISVNLVSPEEKKFLEKYAGELKNLMTLKIEEALIKTNDYLETQRDTSSIQMKKNVLEGFFIDNMATDLRWVPGSIKNPNESNFQYFDPEIKAKIPSDLDLECLNCKICKEFLKKTQTLIGKKFEILKYFKVSEL